MYLVTAEYTYHHQGLIIQAVDIALSFQVVLCVIDTVLSGFEKKISGMNVNGCAATGAIFALLCCL